MDQTKLVDESPRKNSPFTLSLRNHELTYTLRQFLATPENRSSPVIWCESDSEMVVYPYRLRTVLQSGLVLIELPVATDQSGRDVLVVPLIVGKTPSNATLVAVTETMPRGNPLLIARWGYTVQEVLWQAILQIGQDRLSNFREAEGMTVSGLYALPDELMYVITCPCSATEISEYFENVNLEEPDPLPPEPIPTPPKDVWGCLVYLINLVLKLFRIPLYAYRHNRG